VAGTISTPLATSVTFTGPLTVAPRAGAVIFTVAPLPACAGAERGKSAAAADVSASPATQHLMGIRLHIGVCGEGLEAV